MNCAQVHPGQYFFSINLGVVVFFDLSLPCTPILQYNIGNVVVQLLIH